MFSRIVERFSLIHGYRHDWPNHVKTLCTFMLIYLFFVLEFMCLFIKAFVVIRNGIKASKLKIFGRTKDYEAHKIKIKGILVQDGVNYSLIKM